MPPADPPPDVPPADPPVVVPPVDWPPVVPDVLFVVAGAVGVVPVDGVAVGVGVVTTGVPIIA